LSISVPRWSWRLKVSCYCSNARRRIESVARSITSRVAFGAMPVMLTRRTGSRLSTSINSERVSRCLGKKDPWQLVGGVDTVLQVAFMVRQACIAAGLSGEIQMLPSNPIQGTSSNVTEAAQERKEYRTPLPNAHQLRSRPVVSRTCRGRHGRQSLQSVPRESQAIGLVNILKRIVQVISNRDVKILRRY